jgi:hypothetical protein
VLRPGTGEAAENKGSGRSAQAFMHNDFLCVGSGLEEEEEYLTALDICCGYTITSVDGCDAVEYSTLFTECQYHMLACFYPQPRRLWDLSISRNYIHHSISVAASDTRDLNYKLRCLAGQRPSSSRLLQANDDKVNRSYAAQTASRLHSCTRPGPSHAGSCLIA